MATKYGTTGNDNPLRGTPENDFIYALAGDDLIITDDGDDYVEAGDGDDQVNGYPGLKGAYTYYNAKGRLTIYGGNGNDFLVGGEGNDKIFGDSGNDILYGRGGNDILNGGDGDDTLNAQSDGDDSLYGGNGKDVLNAYAGTGDKILDGGSGNDELHGGTGHDRLLGGAGDDNIDGNEGNDTLDGEDGNDTIEGGSGNDILKGGIGNDRLITGEGNDTAYGGDGNDQINGYSTGEPNHAYKSWSATEDLKLYGEAGHDFIVGGTGSDFISGGTGDDEIFAEEGNDTVYGEPGNDYISVGKGNDFAYGGDGNDRILTGDGSDYIEGGNGDDEINSYIVSDGQRIRWTYSGNVNAHGNDGNDVITGSSGSDELYGDNGNDKLFGDEGNDILDGGSGINELKGGLGNDTYYVRNQQDFIQDTGGIDTAYVSASFVKIPSTIEKVIYTEGAQALPYWVDALLPDEAAGLYYKTLLQNSSVFNYSFPKILPSYDKSSKHADGFLSFTLDQMSRTKEALAYISSLINLQFRETVDANQLNTLSFANNNQTGSAGYAQMPDDTPGGSDVFLDKSSRTTLTLKDGQYQTLTLIHEVGHALGLEHPFSAPSAGTNVIADPPYLNSVEDTTAWTVMSYTDSPAQYYLQYSPLDIAALQYMYGPSTTSRTGNDIYKISQSAPNFIWDGAGSDTIDLSGINQGSTVYLTPGYWGFTGNAKASNITTAGQITVNFGTTIENLNGSPFADKLFGNEVANVMNGGNGNDLIEGWDGNDTLIGGQGDDQLNGGTGLDVVQLSGNWSNYATAKNSSAFVATDKRSGQDGIDSLINIERLKFLDKTLAIDLDGNAGITAKVIGAVLGKDAVKNPTIFGIGLSYADKGWSYSELGALALNAVGAVSHDAIVSAIWKNLVGFDATPEVKAPFIKMLQDGLKPGDFVVMASEHLLNVTNIGLVGLTQTGIEYVPV